MAADWLALTERLVAAAERLEQPRYSFRPRPDSPAEFDEQASFVDSRAFVSFALGGNGCIAADTPLYDPTDGSSLTAGERVGKPFHHWSRDPETGEAVVGWSPGVFLKGVNDLVRVTLSDGQSFVCTNQHRLLDASGCWRAVHSLSVGESLMPTAVIAAIEAVGVGEFYDLTSYPHHCYYACGAWHHNSGKSAAAAHHVDRFIESWQSPPRRDTPFWCVSSTLPLASRLLWKEKLSKIIPRDRVDWDRVTWYSSKEELPEFLPLKPWPGDDTNRNWALHFKSFEQGWGGFSGESIGGAWLSETFTLPVLHEIIRGTREYAFPGSIVCECTPIDPGFSISIEPLYHDPPKGWRFFRLNTKKNLEAGGIQQDWFDTFFSSVSEEMREVRMTGALAGFEGAIFQTFNPRVHVVDFDAQFWPPTGCRHYRGLDWGASAEHPFACVWGAVDSMGTWYIYDEYVCGDQVDSQQHIDLIKEAYPWDRPHWHRQTWADPSRPDQLALFARKGIPVGRANNDVYGGIETIRSLLKPRINLAAPWLPPAPRLYISSRCKTLIRQMGTYQWLKSSGKGLNPQAARPVPLKRNDDAVDALRYLLHSTITETSGLAPQGVEIKRRKLPGAPLDKAGRRPGLER